MPIPALKDGRLPPGIHSADRDEIAMRFCSSTPERQRLLAPLDELISIARAAGSPGLYLNGSFVSDKEGPRDIDAVLILPRGFNRQGPLAIRLRSLHREFGFDIEQVPVDDEEERDYFLNDFFATDRDGNPRGLIGVIL